MTIGSGGRRVNRDGTNPDGDAGRLPRAAHRQSCNEEREDAREERLFPRGAGAPDPLGNSGACSASLRENGFPVGQGP